MLGIFKSQTEVIPLKTSKQDIKTKIDFSQVK